MSVRTAFAIQIDSKRGGGGGAGRPKLTWKKRMEKDCIELKLTTVHPQERSTWRSGVISAMYGGPLMGMMPAHLYVNQKSDYNGNEAVVIWIVRPNLNRLNEAAQK